MWLGLCLIIFKGLVTETGFNSGYKICDQGAANKSVLEEYLFWRSSKRLELAPGTCELEVCDIFQTLACTGQRGYWLSELCVFEGNDLKAMWSSVPDSYSSLHMRR